MSTQVFEERHIRLYFIVSNCMIFFLDLFVCFSTFPLPKNLKIKTLPFQFKLFYTIYIFTFKLYHFLIQRIFFFNLCIIAIQVFSYSMNIYHTDLALCIFIFYYFIANYVSILWSEVTFILEICHWCSKICTVNVIRMQLLVQL